MGTEERGAGPPRGARTLVLASVAALAGCGLAVPRGDPGGHEMLNAALWTQSSGEYRAAARQAYRVATANLDRALADPRWSAALEQIGDVSGLPPAVMLDVDETVLDNSRYEARIVLEHGRFSPETFRRWCEERAAGAVPGVGDFLAAARARRVHVIYFSARKEALRGCTEATLRRLGLPFTGSEALLLDDGRSKSAHRRRVADRYRILLLIGDNLEDFVDGSRAPPEARVALAARHRSRWGDSWILLPNPMYGHWEATHYDFRYELPRAQQLERKRSALRP